MDTFNRDDQWVPVREGVILNPILEESISNIRKYFSKHQHKTAVTSGFRSPEAQVQAILSNARKAGIAKLYLEFANGCDGTWPVNVKRVIDNVELYWWQRTWSELLHRNYIVNPPLDAICLYNSFRPNGTNRKGTLIRQTPHSRGLSYDIGGGIDYNPNDEYAILLEAKEDPTTLLSALVLETMNGCVHCDVRKDVPQG